MKMNNKSDNENALGKGEVGSSILPRSTTPHDNTADQATSGASDAQPGAERRENAHTGDVENPWNPFASRSPESSGADTAADVTSHESTAPYVHPYGKDRT